MIHLIPHVTSPLDEPAYQEPDIRAVATEVVEFDDGDRGLLAVSTKHNHIHFGCFNWVLTDKNDVRMYDCVFFGEGFGAPLREMRHTHWGESGYLFYADRVLIAEALKALGKWFD